MEVTPLIPGIIFQGSPLNNRETGGKYPSTHIHTQVQARAYFIHLQPSRFPGLIVAFACADLLTLVHWMRRGIDEGDDVECTGIIDCLLLIPLY